MLLTKEKELDKKIICEYLEVWHPWVGEYTVCTEVWYSPGDGVPKRGYRARGTPLSLAKWRKCIMAGQVINLVFLITFSAQSPRLIV